MTSPHDPFLRSLIARFLQPGVIGLAIVGSYSRGTQDPYSDVDLDIFVDELPQDSYTLRFLDGKLVSVKYLLLRDEFDSLTKPESAVWAVPGLRQMQILTDEQGELARLRQVALDFDWSTLQAAANDYAACELALCSEEAHKIMGGLLNEDESRVLYASWGMFKDLSFAAAVQAGLMIETENRIFSLIQERFSEHPDWVRAFRLSFGMDVEAGVPAYRTRGLASLDLFEQTAVLFKDILTGENREVTGNTLQLIASFRTSFNPMRLNRK